MTTPSTLRAEVRALGPDRCLITTPAGRSFTVDIAASNLLRMLDAWATGQASSTLPAGWEASAQPLRDALTRDGAFSPADPIGLLPETEPF